MAIVLIRRKSTSSDGERGARRPLRGGSPPSQLGRSRGNAWRPGALSRRPGFHPTGPVRWSRVVRRRSPSPGGPATASQSREALSAAMMARRPWWANPEPHARQGTLRSGSPGSGCHEDGGSARTAGRSVRSAEARAIAIVSPHALNIPRPGANASFFLRRRDSWCILRVSLDVAIQTSLGRVGPHTPPRPGIFLAPHPLPLSAHSCPFPQACAAPVLRLRSRPVPEKHQNDMFSICFSAEARYGIGSGTVGKQKGDGDGNLCGRRHRRPVHRGVG